MQFEWDDDKREINFVKHGIDFPLAASVFLDADRIERIDHRKDYGETRHQIIGRAKGLLLFVVYTRRGHDVIRLISARRANKNEQKTYLHPQRPAGRQD